MDGFLTAICDGHVLNPILPNSTIPDPPEVQAGDWGHSVLVGIEAPIDLSSAASTSPGCPLRHA
eukprot:4231984-Amphidinium_carterae.1